LPEEVIKGNQIKKEIGGGMCQIGTTLFRMAMNAGMPITERTNHSLVVGYYADPVNGNPGTDATVYEPILDFKFFNDTGGYLLLETNIDFKKQQLKFTLWGKPDGRTGSYTHPIVSKWIPAGEPQITYTDTLKPGEQKCQNAFRGAVASFTYTRYTSTTEKIDRVFTSYYRPLPKICMVGADPTVCPDMKNCAPAVSGSSTPAGGGAATSSSTTTGTTP
jgi:vancomycin resistance protein YoaR